MALPLLVTLSASARLALPYVQSLVAEGVSTAAIQAYLPSVMGGLRRTELLSLVRAIKGNELKRPYLDSLKDTTLPSPSRLGTPVTTTLRAFSYVVEIFGTNTETGEPMSSMVTVSSSVNLTKGRLKEIGMNLAESGSQRGTKSGGFGMFSAHNAKLKSGTFSGNL